MLLTVVVTTACYSERRQRRYRSNWLAVTPHPSQGSTPWAPLVWCKCGFEITRLASASRTRTRSIWNARPAHCLCGYSVGVTLNERKFNCNFHANREYIFVTCQRSRPRLTWQRSRRDSPARGRGRDSQGQATGAGVCSSWVNMTRLRRPGRGYRWGTSTQILQCVSDKKKKHFI